MVNLVVTNVYLVVTSGYLIAVTGYFSLLWVTSGYFSLLLIPRFSDKGVTVIVSVAKKLIITVLFILLKQKIFERSS